MNHAELLHGTDRDQALLRRAKKFFGSWNNALRKIGLNPAKIKYDAYWRGIRKRSLQHSRYPDEESVLKAMKQRNQEGRFLNCAGLLLGVDRDQALWRRASQFFGSWSNALRKIGLDPVKIKHDARGRGALQRCRYPDEESLLKAMKQRSQEGRFMNCAGLLLGVDRDQALLRRAKKFFGSWNNALRKIGLDPAQIKRDPVARAVYKQYLQKNKDQRRVSTNNK